MTLPTLTEALVPLLPTDATAEAEHAAAFARIAALLLGEVTLRIAGVAHRIVGDATLFDVVFTDRPVRDYRDVLAGDKAKNAAFNARLREKGIFKSPGKLYPSLALTEEDLALTADAIAYAVEGLEA